MNPTPVLWYAFLRYLGRLCAQECLRAGLYHDGVLLSFREVKP
jgi:hypothetical protein